MVIPSVTLETSCVISLLRIPGDKTPETDLQALEQLKKWDAEKIIELWISEKSRTEAELNLKTAEANDPANLDRINKWLRTLNSLKGYPVVEGRFVFGVSKLKKKDSGLFSNNEEIVYNELSQFLFGKLPKDLNKGDLFDFIILFEHYIQGNDFFVTRDRSNKMLEKKDDLFHQWKIVVCEPLDIISLLEDRIMHWGY
jgi:hypothetical protein